jgi:hypothetical protein
LREHFHQPQHLNELPLAAPAHARLEQPAQMPQALRQGPALQRCSLVDRAGFLFQKRQIVWGAKANSPRSYRRGCRAITSASQASTTSSTKPLTSTSRKPNAVGTE